MDTSGVKVIRHTGEIDKPDDPSFPFKLEINLSPPEFMSVAFIMLYGGSEEIMVRGMTRADIDDFIALHNLKTHPRLRWGKITGPNVAEEFKP